MSQQPFKPIYTTFQSVKVRLANKVQFQADPNDLQDGELPDDLLGQLIVDAETEVEQDLRSRYAIPFRSATKGTYSALPDHTQRALRVLIDLKSVWKVLSTDFGSGTHINPDGYKKSLTEEYETHLARVMGQDLEGKNEKHDRFRFSPPLDDLLLSPTNKEADDGFKGMIINTDSAPGVTGYAGDQINNPSQNYINVALGDRRWWSRK